MGKQQDTGGELQQSNVLSETLGRYRALMDNASDAILIANDQGYLVDANRKAEKLFGYSLAELKQLHAAQLHPPDSVEIVRAHFEALVQEKQESQPLECLILCKDGSTKPVEIISTLIPHEGKRFTQGILRDISARKQAKLALQESKRLFQRMTESVPGMIYQYVRYPDGHHHFPYISPYVKDIYGLDPEAVIEDPSVIFACVHPDDISLLQAQTERSNETVQEFRSEHRIIATDGTLKWVQIVANPELQGDGSVLWQGVVLDITQQKQTELALQESQLQFQRMTENIPGMIYRYVRYPDGRDALLYVSPQCRSIFDVEPDVALKDIGAMWEKVHPDDVLKIKAELDYSAVTLTSYVRENRLCLPNQQIRWIRDIARPQQTDNGAVVWDGLVLDISKSKSYEERLEQTNAELKRVTRLKDEFLASMSHELRTPLNAILGMAELLTNGTYGNLDLHQIKAVETIARSGEHLLELINDILDLAKIEAGKVELDLETVALGELCQQSLELVRFQAEKKEIALNLRLPSPEIYLRVDPRRLRQALLNLLSNAVKFTPEGGQVSLLAYADPQSDWIYLDVADTGIGIAPGDRHKLFQPFTQIDSNLNRQYSGTGLGLALVRRIAELHQGHVVFTSEPGQGSCFTVVLPQTAIVSAKMPDRFPFADSVPNTDPPQLTPIADAPLSHKPRLVIAEDNPDTLDALQDYLIPRGYDVAIAHNGQAAIDLIRRYKPDLVLMDIQMPVMDGLEAMGIIRQDPEFQRLPIIALTALAMTGDQDRLRRAGATDYLSKPVKLSQLNCLIRSLLAQKEGIN